MISKANRQTFTSTVLFARDPLAPQSCAQLQVHKPKGTTPTQLSKAASSSLAIPNWILLRQHENIATGLSFTARASTFGPVSPHAAQPSILHAVSARKLLQWSAVFFQFDACHTADDCMLFRGLMTQVLASGVHHEYTYITIGWSPTAQRITRGRPNIDECVTRQWSVA